MNIKRGGDVKRVPNSEASDPIEKPHQDIHPLDIAQLCSDVLDIFIDGDIVQLDLQVP